MWRSQRGERGFVLPTRLTALGVGALVIGGLVLVLTGGSGDDDKATPTAAKHSTSLSATPSATTAPSSKPKAKPAVKRKDFYVEIYNNSNLKGLAGRTAGRASAVGWNVVGSDNWHGNVDAPTVYYSPRLETAAKLLARDLGIDRLKPAIEPMRMDRLTVILTDSYR